MTMHAKIAGLALWVAALVCSTDAAAAPPPWMAGGYEERLQAIRSAGPADAAALEEFLGAPPGQCDATVEELAALKNEAGMILVQMPRPPASLARRFLALAADPAADPVWRDYCVQFLGMGFPKWSDGDRKAAAAFLETVAKDWRGATGGTALIALYHNAGRPEIGVERVGTLALAAARDPRYGDAGRISALQVCAGLNVAAVLPVARVLANESETLRASAIAVIGALGGREDAPTLREWAKSADRGARAPAVAALRRIEERSRGKPREAGL